MATNHEGTGLSGREAHVLYLAAEGLVDREI